MFRHTWSNISDMFCFVGPNISLMFGKPGRNRCSMISSSLSLFSLKNPQKYIEINYNITTKHNTTVINPKSKYYVTNSRAKLQDGKKQEKWEKKLTLSDNEGREKKKKGVRAVKNEKWTDA